MQNHFAPKPDSSSYTNLKERVFQQIQATGINDRIFESVQKAYEEALTRENVILSRPERKHLLSMIMKLVLKDMVTKIENRSNPD